MIVIPENTEISKEFRGFIEFFNCLEQDLEWPVCEGKSEARRILKLNDSKFREMIDQMAGCDFEIISVHPFTEPVL